jgi:uncharacterized membrane protein YkvA (DUF1232 family)
MTDEKKNWLGPYIPQGNVFREIVQQAKLAYQLMLDPRVHPLTKLIPVAAVAYLFFPVDVIPDFALGLGQLDDIAIVMLGLRTFFELAPAEVVQEHLKQLARAVSWQMTDEPPAPPKPPAEDVVDGSFTDKPE